jgi:hypothetical protein
MKSSALSMIAIAAGLTLLPNIQASSASQMSSHPRPVTVSVTYGIFVPGDSSNAENSAKLQEKGRRIIYTMASKECQIIRETIAETCTMTRISVRTNNYHRRPNQGPDGVRMNGSANYKIQPK